jgi:uncharacterized protein YdhG (YjbR/CyaY superfamily)
METRMMSAPAPDIDTYLAAVPEADRAVLAELRRIIHDAAPGADEVISYGIPAVRFHGPLVAFSAAKGHASLHLMSVAVKKAHEAGIAPLGTTAATVHFPYDKPLPAALVKMLVRARVAENLEREAHSTKKTPAPRRARNPMPVSVKAALEESGLMAAYDRRPPYQQNDYLGWIDHAKREETKAQRLMQMLDELKAGNVYMKMKWNAKSKGGE